jgi:hypothetical protein
MAKTPSPQRLASTRETLVGREARPPDPKVSFCRDHGNHASSQTVRDIPELELILRSCPEARDVLLLLGFLSRLEGSDAAEGATRGLSVLLDGLRIRS